MKILIGATFAILVASLVIAYQQMKSSEIDSSDSHAQEIARIEKRIAQLESALASNQQAPTTAPQPITASNPHFQQSAPANPLEQHAQNQAHLRELEQLRAELAKANAGEQKALSEVEAANKKAARADGEASALAKEVVDRRKPNDARGRQIINALLMASITQYDEQEKIGAIKIERTTSVSEGLILGIRRNSGIVGRIRVGAITGDRAIFDPIPGSFFNGKIDIRISDELVVPPAF